MKQRQLYPEIFIPLFLLLAEFIFPVPAGASQPDTLSYRLPFYTEALGEIQDPAGMLEEFVVSMGQLRNGKDTVVRIVHLGDSHIQAGFLTGKTMRLLQEVYGNAGRGWIAPLKLTKTNEPFDYFISADVREWIAGRVVQSTKKTVPGPGGIGIESSASSIRMQVGVTPKNGVGYSFNELLFFRGDEAMPMVVTGRLQDSVQVGYGKESFSPGVLVDTFRVSCLTDTLLLKSTRQIPGTEKTLGANRFRNIYYGCELRNGNPGILYHSIGINGAMFVNYTDEAYLRQLGLLKPDLLIISLGTNETFGRRFTEAEFTRQVQDFVRILRNSLPDTPILLTTPPEGYKSKTVNKKKEYYHNEHVQKVARAIVWVAKGEGLAYWDLFTATGGPGSSRHWYDGKWMGRDRIHFNQNGYTEQGILLFRALHQLVEKRGVTDYLTGEEE